MGASATPARICPECGTRNSGLSLFCSECGASLTNAATESAADSQTTTTFTPASPAAPGDPYTTQQFQPQAAPASAPSTTTTAPAAPSGWVAPAYATEPEHVGNRGMVLGWLAAILILLVIAYLGWTSFLGEGTRDSIIGIFT